MFLMGVFIALTASVVFISWLSKKFIFGELQPPFIGALVGAAGTIFAGCIAFTAASENVRIAKAATDDAIAQRNRLEEQVARTAREARAAELEALKDLKRYLETVVNRIGAGKDDYFQRVYDAELNGELTAPYAVTRAPEQYRGRAMENLARFYTVRNAVMRTAEQTANKELFEENRKSANEAIEDRLAELKLLADDLNKAIMQRLNNP